MCARTALVLVALAAARLHFALALDVDGVLAAQRAGLEAVALRLARVLVAQCLHTRRKDMS